MRVRIIFNLKNRGGYVPFHHQFLIAQLIRGFIASGDRADYLSYNQYNFSGLKGQTKVSRKGLHFYSAKITLVFSAIDKEFLDYFTKLILKQPEFMIGTLLVQPESVEPDVQPKFSSVGKYLCISPIVILKATLNSDEGKRFILPTNEEFSDMLYENTMERMEASGNYAPEQMNDFFKVQLVADEHYIQRIQEQNKKFARIYPMYDNDIKYEVRGYTFPFSLYAPAEVQHFIYNYGIGLYNHKGFGMVDLAHDGQQQEE